MNGDFSNFLAIEDISGALIMLWATFRITTKAGFSSTQARWALFRRGLYCAMAAALFSLGVHRSHGVDPVGFGEFVSQSVILFGIMVFPLLRALTFITQDAFDSFHGLQRGAGEPDRK